MLSGYPSLSSSDTGQTDFSGGMQDQNNIIFNLFNLQFQQNIDPSSSSSSSSLLNPYNPAAYANAVQSRLLFPQHRLTSRNQSNLSNSVDASVEQLPPANTPSYLSNNNYLCCACGTDWRFGVHLIPADHNPYVTSNESASSNSSGNSWNPLLHGNRARQDYVPRASTNILKAWLKRHMKYPYPTNEEKKMLASMSALTLTKVTSWFIKTRYRWKKRKKLTWPSKYRYSSQQCRLDVVSHEQDIAMPIDFSSNLDDAKIKIWSLANIAATESSSMPSQSCVSDCTESTSEQHPSNANNIQHSSSINVSHTT